MKIFLTLILFFFSKLVYSKNTPVFIGANYLNSRPHLTFANHRNYPVVDDDIFGISHIRMDIGKFTGLEITASAYRELYNKFYNSFGLSIGDGALSISFNKKDYYHLSPGIFLGPRFRLYDSDLMIFAKAGGSFTNIFGKFRDGYTYPKTYLYKGFGVFYSHKNVVLEFDFNNFNNNKIYKGTLALNFEKIQFIIKTEIFRMWNEIKDDKILFLVSDPF